MWITLQWWWPPMFYAACQMNPASSLRTLGRKWASYASLYSTWILVSWRECYNTYLDTYGESTDVQATLTILRLILEYFHHFIKSCMHMNVLLDVSLCTQSVLSYCVLTCSKSPLSECFHNYMTLYQLQVHLLLLLVLKYHCIM